MTDIAIRVENLSKLYHIGKLQRRHDTLREALVDAVPAPRRWRLDRGPATGDRSASRLPLAASGQEDDLLWALRDVSFDVHRGEVIGIIGRNGAGKSTLLKILSRITEPTEGRAEIHGRVGSLLEVGTGFHPELTGRENIFLNGAILGMRRAEIVRRFDEIVAFAEIERFLDTPVKRYSSGMYVRLAFAVAAHLEPEILLVDEVLAVGDAAFQKKCLGKMGDVAKEGRTVLFVSHNLEAITRLCSRAVLLQAGSVLTCEQTSSAVDKYLRIYATRAGQVEFAPGADKELAFLGVTVLGPTDSAEDVLYADKPISVAVDYQVNQPMQDVQIVLQIYTARDLHVLSTAEHDCLESIPWRRVGRYRTIARLPCPLLAPGLYRTEVACGVPNVRVIDRQDGPTFEIHSEDTSFALWSRGRRGTVVNVMIPWGTAALEPQQAIASSHTCRKDTADGAAAPPSDAR